MALSPDDELPSASVFGPWTLPSAVQDQNRANEQEGEGQDDEPEGREAGEGQQRGDGCGQHGAQGGRVGVGGGAVGRAGRVGDTGWGVTVAVLAMVPAVAAGAVPLRV